MKTDKKTAVMFAEIVEVRKILANPTDDKQLEEAMARAAAVFKSEEFGNFLSLSTIYRIIAK